MSTSEKKIKILITTRPGSDGFGDLYSANRFKLLLRELRPNWDIELYALRTLPMEICAPERRKFIEDINRRCNELGLASSEKAIEFDPNIHISVAGYMASGDRGHDAEYENFDPKIACTNIEYRTMVMEYMDQYMRNGMMKVAEIEKKAMPPIQKLGISLPSDIKYKLHTGDYYFAYGKIRTASYIRHLISRSTDKPIYFVVPGLKTIGGIDFIRNAIHYDINTGKVIKESRELSGSESGDSTIEKAEDKVDVVLIRGSVPQNAFMCLLYNTAKPHVMVTGDMSFTEALDAGKIPFLDWVTGSMTERLYGEYLIPFAKFSRGSSSSMDPAGLDLLDQPGKIEEIQKYLFNKYREMNKCAEEIVNEIQERYLALKWKKESRKTSASRIFETEQEDTDMKDRKTPKL